MPDSNEQLSQGMLMGKPATPLGTWGKVSISPLPPAPISNLDFYARVKAPADVLAWMRGNPGAMARIAASLSKRDLKAVIIYEAATRYRDPSTGRSVRLRARGSTPSKAKTALSEKIAQRRSVRSGAGSLTSESRMGQLFDAYLDRLTVAPGKLRPQTIQKKRDSVRATLRPAFEHLTIRELTAPPIDEFLQEIIETGHLSVAKEATIVLREVLRLSNRLGLTVVDPKILVPNAPRPARAGSAEKPVRYLTAKQVDLLRRALHRWYRDRLGRPGPAPDGQPVQLLEVMTGGALRPGEAAALLLRNLFIDGENTAHPFLIVDGTIVLRDGSVWRQPETKTGRGRTVALPAAAVHAIRQRLAVIEALQAAGKREANGPDDLLFGTRAGTPFQSTNLRRSFGYATDLLDDVSVEGFATFDFTPHMARRSAATAVFHHPDGSAASTSAMLGHSGEAQLPAYVAKLGLPAPDFSVIAALDGLLPILDESTL